MKSRSWDHSDDVSENYSGSTFLIAVMVSGIDRHISLGRFTEKGMEMMNIDRFELVLPNPDLIRLTEKVVEQNRLIIEMNATLLRHLAAPYGIVGSFAKEG